MTIREFANFFTYFLVSPLHEPETGMYVLENVFKISLRGTLGTGGVALISAIFSRYIMHEGIKAVAPYVLKASLGSCGAFAFVTGYIFTRVLGHAHPDPIGEKLSENAELLEKKLVFLTAGVFTVFLAKTFWKETHPWNAIATSSLGLPIAFCFDTITSLYFYHKNQNAQRPKATLA